MKITFHTTQVNTRGDGVELPEGAVIDNVEHVSMGEYVNVQYHVVRDKKEDEHEAVPYSTTFQGDSVPEDHEEIPHSTFGT